MPTYAIYDRDASHPFTKETPGCASINELYLLPRVPAGSLYCRVKEDRTKVPIYRFNGQMWEEWEPPLSYRQERAVVDAFDGHNVFLTGLGGGGKSTVCRHIVKVLRSRGLGVAVTGSTGIAAITAGGSTIHSLLGLGVSKNLKEARLKFTADTLGRVREKFENIRVLVIDEVSMLTGDYITMMDRWLRKVTGVEEPFGGIQIIVVGDLLQLPPVVTEADERHLDLRYCIQSPAWAEANFKVHHLSESFRQADKEHVSNLNRLRVGDVDERVLAYFNQRVKAALADEPTRIYPINADVDAANERHLESLPGEAFAWMPTYTGHEKWVEKLQGNLPCESPLVLCTGAKVIFIKNNMNAGFANGTRGEVVFCTPDKITVKTRDGEIDVPKLEWHMKDESEKILASVRQYPLTLAAACTVHRSQGLTLDYVEYDPRRTFDKGMAYVALSRVRSMQGLSLTAPMNEKHVKVSKICVRYYNEMAKEAA